MDNKEKSEINTSVVVQNNKICIILLKVASLFVLAVSVFLKVQMPNISARIGNAIGSAMGAYIVFMVLTYLPLLLIKNIELRQKISVILIFIISLIYAVCRYFM